MQLYKDPRMEATAYQNTQRGHLSIPSRSLCSGPSDAPSTPHTGVEPSPLGPRWVCSRLLALALELGEDLPVGLEIGWGL